MIEVPLVLWLHGISRYVELVRVNLNGQKGIWVAMEHSERGVYFLEG